MNRFLVIFSLTIVIFAGCESGLPTHDTTMTNQLEIENMGIDEAVELIPDRKQKKMLLKFKRGFEKGTTFLVTSRKECFEIVVTHPSGKDISGGAEQYFLYKETGKTKMGWQEHPMTTG
jgi:hypothetical protein